MKEITAKLVHVYTDKESGKTQRYYELSEPITKGYKYYGDFDIVAEIAKQKESIIEKYQQFVNDDGARYICISDAIGHIERLVFVGVRLGDIGYSRLRIKIDGIYTMSIHGGCISAVYDDAVYIRHLAMLNKVTIRIIES